MRVEGEKKPKLSNPQPPPPQLEEETPAETVRSFSSNLCFLLQIDVYARRSVTRYTSILQHTIHAISASYHRSVDRELDGRPTSRPQSNLEPW